jgi:hypothetical protein
MPASQGRNKYCHQQRRRNNKENTTTSVATTETKKEPESDYGRKVNFSLYIRDIYYG